MSFFTHTMPRESLPPVDARIAQIHRIPTRPNACAPDVRRNREEA